MQRGMGMGGWEQGKGSRWGIWGDWDMGTLGKGVLDEGFGEFWDMGTLGEVWGCWDHGDTEGGVQDGGFRGVWDDGEIGSQAGTGNPPGVSVTL